MKNNLNEHFENLRQQASGNDVAIQTAQQTQSPLSFVVPVELVSLPSEGKYYPDGHPLKDKAEIEIKQMTAKEEDILTNKSYIKKGIVVDKLIESLIIDKSINVSSLLIGDKNAIMIAARSAAYGSAYELAITCMECSTKKLQTIDLNEAEVTTATAAKEAVIKENIIRFENCDHNSVLMQLPKTGWIVECRFLNGKDENNMLTFLEAKKAKKSGDELSLTEQLAFIISSINTVSDPQSLGEAIKLMPASDAKFLRNNYQKLIPNIKIVSKFSCEACGAQQDLEVPFTQEFFWPK